MSDAGNRAPDAAFPQPFTRHDRRTRQILIPNLSHAFGRVSAAVLRRCGYDCLAMPLADDNAKRLGKRFVHNDMCYPAQINIGECLDYLTRHPDKVSRTAAAIAKNCEACRAGQYASMARKALDTAGFGDVPLVTTGRDTKGMHPGFRFGLRAAWGSLWGVGCIDAMERMRLKTRPYELNAGDSDRVFDESLDALTDALEHRPRTVLRVLERSVAAFNAVPVNGATRPRVFVIGEILMNYHDTANNNIVRYLEKNGFEVILPDISTFFASLTVTARASLEKGIVRSPFVTRLVAGGKRAAFSLAGAKIDRVMRAFDRYEPVCGVEELATNAEGIIERTHSVGEGWLLATEIIEHARRGVRAFVVIQPFGCLPNQVSGKALIPRLKEMFPDIHIVSIDYDADSSPANIENRLQMLIMAVGRPDDIE